MQAAYAAMQANPVPERQLEALQRLLGDLCARGRVDALVRLPFAGTLLLPPGAEGGSSSRQPRLLSLADEALRCLKRHAHNAELSARPQPYQVWRCTSLSIPESI
jgi:hypothetical protein